MRRSIIAVLVAVAAIAGPACKQKKDHHAPAAGKPVSPPAIEPLPAPRASGQLPSPAGTPTETSSPAATPTDTSSPADTSTRAAQRLDAGAPPDREP